MSLPAETNFPNLAPDSGLENSLLVCWRSRGGIALRTKDDGGWADMFLDRTQVESLRDQLNEWLEVAK